MKNDINKVNCFQCGHFAISWDKQSPRSCKLFGIKSANMPSVAVYNTTGTACMGFIEKDRGHNPSK